MAQLGPVTWYNYGGYNPYGYGSWGAYNSNVALAQDNRLASQSRVMAQNATVQSGIRNSLSQQADTRTQNYLNQRQDYRDWWFQTQQQQFAASKARAAAQPAASASFAGYEPPTETEIIKWPTLLQDPIFTRQRARIEGPYLRNPQGPSAQDYRDMVDAVAQMKGLLAQKLAFGYGISQKESWNASNFLDQLAKEAGGYAAQLEAAQGAATPGKKTAMPPESRR